MMQRHRAWFGAGLALLSMFEWGPPTRAQTNPNSQVLKLPDPTPRELESNLRYSKEDPDAEALKRRVSAAQAEKRRQLVVWAANELVILSERAELAAASPVASKSKADVAMNVSKIEALAKNLAVALKAQ